MTPQESCMSLLKKPQDNPDVHCHLIEVYVQILVCMVQSFSGIANANHPHCLFNKRKWGWHRQNKNLWPTTAHFRFHCPWSFTRSCQVTVERKRSVRLFRLHATVVLNFTAWGNSSLRNATVNSNTGQRMLF